MSLRFAVNCSILFTELPLYERPAAARAVGFEEVEFYGVDHVKVAEGLGCKALRVFEPDGIQSALEEARKLMAEFEVPVIVEVILERITNVSMGTEIDNVIEFEEVQA